MQTTPRLGLRVPDGTVDSPDVPLWMLRLAQDVEGSFQVGLASARPAAGKAGRRYFATDTSQDSVDDGTQWRDAGTPVGAILDWGSAGDPAGGLWLLCDGRALSRTTYAALFTSLGTAYGAGDGSTTFAIPDCRGRVTVGPDTMGTAAGAAARLTANAARGNFGGEEKHTLSRAEMPKLMLEYGTTQYNTTAPGGQYQQICDTGGGYQASNQGGGLSHNTMQPFVVVNKIIRVR
jgi:microcystin-dependent protein